MIGKKKQIKLANKRVQEDQQENLINARSALAADRRVKYGKNKTMLGEV